MPAGQYTASVVAVNGLGASAPTSSPVFAVTGAAGTYASAVLADSPVVFYRLGDAPGSPMAADSSGHGRVATVSSAVGFGQAGALATDSGAAAGFGWGAEAQLASGAGLPTGNGSRSIEAWFKTSDTGQQVIAWWGSDAPNEEMELGINGGNEIYWTGEYNEADFTSPASFADDSWHQLVVTYDGASRTAVGYLDGTLLGSHALGSGWDTTLDATGLMVGGPQYHGYYLDGELDDVAIYDHALSPARVLAHYSASRLAGLATTTYAYDAAGRVASRTDADGRTTSYGHDADGNQVTMTDAMGRVTTSAFDADDRLVAVAYSDGTTPGVAYAYDADGRRTSMTDDTGTSAYAYNPAGQLTGVTNGAGATVGYGYDALGRVDSIAYPDGRAATRAFDADGRLASVTDWNGQTTSFGYDGDGNLTSTTYPNGVTQTTAVDAADQPTATDTAGPGGAALANFGYAYTPGGLVASTTDSLAPSGGHTYGYNPDDQLVGQDGDPAAYGHDGAANLTGTGAGDALTYDGAGQLLSDQPAAGAPATAYSHDADGDRTGATTGMGDDQATTTYTYDQAGHLVGYASAATGVDVTYSYDGGGLRASSTTTGGTAEYAWDQATGSLPLLLSDGTNDYLYGPGGRPIEQIAQADGATTWLVADRLGSIRLATDNNGNVVGTSTFDAYGNPLATGTPPSRFGYTGQYTDPDGLVYLRARYYDPTTGAFLTQDPAYNQTHAWHAYAGGNPLSNTDPSGLVRLGPDGKPDPGPDPGDVIPGCGNGVRSPAAEGCTYGTLRGTGGMLPSRPSAPPSSPGPASRFECSAFGVNCPGGTAGYSPPGPALHPNLAPRVTDSVFVGIFSGSWSKASPSSKVDVHIGSLSQDSFDVTLKVPGTPWKSTKSVHGMSISHGAGTQDWSNITAAKGGACPFKIEHGTFSCLLEIDYEIEYDPLGEAATDWAHSILALTGEADLEPEDHFPDMFFSFTYEPWKSTQPPPSSCPASVK